MKRNQKKRNVQLLVILASALLLIGIFALTNDGLTGKVTTSSFNCTGPIPENAALCVDDDVGLANNVPRLVVNVCTPSRKCEYLSLELSNDTDNSSTSGTTLPSITTDTSIADLEADIAQLQTQMAQATAANARASQRISTTESDITALQLELDRISSSLANIQNQMATFPEVEGQANQAATGLASLQDDLAFAQSDLADLQTTIEKQEKTTSLMTYGIFFGIALAVAGLLITLLTKKGGSPKEGKVNPEIVSYITAHIKQGWKFPHIKQGLLKAGWTESAIKLAYDSTVSHNYNNYLKSQGKPTRAQNSAARRAPANHPLKQHNNKIILITILGLIIVAGMLFLLQGGVSSGKAIHIQDSFDTSAPVECTPPHIETEGGCCLDENENEICDIDEEYEEDRVNESLDVCSDHVDCQAGEVCIDNECAVLYDLYDRDCAGFKCNVNQIEIETSDGESYTLHGRQGSYAAAGAVEWSIRPIPNYCEGSDLRIPIEIIKSDLFCYDDLGQVVNCDLQEAVDRRMIETVSKEIITLAKDETSDTINHPNPGIDRSLGNFRLTLKDYNEFCTLR